MSFLTSFFKRDRTPEVEVVDRPTIAQLVEQIHTEFRSEGERLLREANEALSMDFSQQRILAHRLRSAGFYNSQTVHDIDAAFEKRQHFQELSTRLQRYQTRYPQNKFIDEAGIERICQKYGLLCGDVELYIGTVPEFNLTEIERLKIHPEDARYVKDVPGGLSEIEIETTYLDFQNYERSHKRYFEGGIIFANPYTRVRVKGGLKICAPPKDFRQSRTKVQGINIVVEDPVVLKPVAGGYLIASAWGPEAKDPEVLNPNKN